MHLLRIALASLANRRFTAAADRADHRPVGMPAARASSGCVTKTRASFASTVSGTDLIVGARAGSLNLLLYSVFRIGNATSNIRWDSFQALAAPPAGEVGGPDLAGRLAPRLPGHGHAARRTSSTTATAASSRCSCSAGRASPTIRSRWCWVPKWPAPWATGSTSRWC